MKSSRLSTNHFERPENINCSGKTCPTKRLYIDPSIERRIRVAIDTITMDPCEDPPVKRMKRSKVFHGLKQTQFLYRKKIEQCMQTTDVAQALIYLTEMASAEIPVTVYVTQVVLNLMLTAKAVDFPIAYRMYQALRRTSSLNESICTAMIKLTLMVEAPNPGPWTIFEDMRFFAIQPKLRTFSNWIIQRSTERVLTEVMALVALLREYQLDCTEIEYCAILDVQEDEVEFLKLLRTFMDDIDQPTIEPTWSQLTRWFGCHLAIQVQPDTTTKDISSIGQHQEETSDIDTKTTATKDIPSNQEVFATSVQATEKTAVIRESPDTPSFSTLLPKGNHSANETTSPNKESKGSPREPTKDTKSGDIGPTQAQEETKRKIQGVEYHMYRESIDPETGIGETSKVQLSSLEINDVTQRTLGQQITSLVCGVDSESTRSRQWTAFQSWLESKGPVDVILDAANIGYFGQNFEGGGFNYAQIQLVVEYYQRQGKKLLIVLHASRTRPSVVPRAFQPLVEEWKTSGLMYCCEKGNNDDWYWLYAGVSCTRSGSPYIISNDLMRDHHFQMLHLRSFRRWKERHQVLFHFKWTGQHQQVFLPQEPRCYSKRCQALAHSFHFPDPESDTWLSFVAKTKSELEDKHEEN